MSEPATASQLATYGHIAAALRSAMAERGWKSAAEINTLIGKPRGYASAYNWINAKAAPEPKTAKMLAKLLGLPPQALMKRTDSEVQNQEPVAHPIAPIIRRVPKVLSFEADADGNANIRLDVTLPVRQAMPLLRILMDAGLMVGSSAEEATHD